ncbi:IS200/IS605 family transposase [Clostridium vitabionis]|uniref:IS200/IS605 family transposase n=1 Tax=Clostridium vitabionis TaxID=2784388 RepID=UPI00188CBEF4|nr:IS200/IS605 family transposase [Clostridium vitabionis]
MKTVYRTTDTTVSMLRYHFVFCPRYRRRIFDIPGVAECFRKATGEACRKNHIEILDMKCNSDHAHLYVSAPPQLSVPEIMRIIKGATTHLLRDTFPELSQMPSLWTRSYFVSTAPALSEATIRRYTETQRTRY